MGDCGVGGGWMLCGTQVSFGWGCIILTKCWRKMGIEIRHFPPFFSNAGVETKHFLQIPKKGGGRNYGTSNLHILSNHLTQPIGHFAQFGWNMGRNTTYFPIFCEIQGSKLCNFFSSELKKVFKTAGHTRHLLRKESPPRESGVLSVYFVNNPVGVRTCADDITARWDNSHRTASNSRHADVFIWTAAESAATQESHAEKT